MKTYLDCIPCFMNQALRAARIATDDEKQIKTILDEVGMMLKNIPLDSSPPKSGRLIYDKVKKKSTQKALSLYPYLKNRIEKSKDRLFTAIRIAIAGNIIDFGTNWDLDIENETYKVLETNFAVCDFDGFKNKLDKVSNVLFLGDNAGECVFDRILIEEIKKPVIYVVRGMPIINDATYEDAVKAGIDRVATIISSGTDAPGTILETCNPEFKKIYKNSDFIISKGQGNYEALSKEKRPIFFLLKIKCNVVADDIGVNIGDIVLKGIDDFIT
jgi:uncharacterized protein with ATP-grasp and redox domains